MSRDELILSHLDLVKRLASRYRCSLKSQVDREDLVGVGNLALVEAAERYQENLGVPFKLFARTRISGAMIDYLRKMDWKTRGDRKKFKKYSEILGDLQNKLQRTPNSSDIAEALGMTLQEYYNWFCHFSVGQDFPLSLDGPSRSDDEGNTPTSLGHYVSSNENIENHLLVKSKHDSLKRAIKCLPVRHQKVLELYYSHEISMLEISNHLGLSQPWVSVSHKKSLRFLRNHEKLTQYQVA
jgi:RNA polymerase sigma factor for flagellar operon FliA